MATEDTLRILVTTDNHLGYLEKDGIRGNDSFNTFEEILLIAQKHDVDFILMAGDLYHENRPSMRCVNEALRLVRTFCLNDKAVKFELLSDPATTFATTSFPAVNYLDPNFNVGMPIFSIHGNHDDPSGPGNICAPDLLHTCGFLNLFGKSNSVEKLDVNPILIKKGSTKLAIYGIGAVREERLHRLFQQNLVKFLRPDQDSDEWFSVSLVHQNRARHGPTGYLPEHFLPEFLDLVIWGHEHDCRIDPEWNSSQNFYVIQPGSSVATSLSEGESIDKAVGLLDIKGREFKLTKLPLETVRPFIFEDLVLQKELPGVDPNSLDANKRVDELCTSRIHAAIKQAIAATSNAIQIKSENCASDTKSQKSKRLLPPIEPLIKLRVDTSGGFESFSALRFGQKFIGRVANPKDLISFNKRRDRSAEASQRSSIDPNPANLLSQPLTTGLSVSNVESLVRGILASSEKQRLNLFTEAELAEGLRKFVGHVDNDGIHAVVDRIVSAAQGHLVCQGCSEERITAEVTRFATNRKRTDSGRETTAVADDDNDFGVKPSTLPSPAHSGDIDDVLEAPLSMRPTAAARSTRGGKQPTLRFAPSEASNSAFHDSDNDLLETIDDVSDSDQGSSANSRLTSGVFSMTTPAAAADSQTPTSSGRGIRGRGRRAASGVASSRFQASSRRRTTRSVVPDEEADLEELSLNPRRKRGRLM